MKSDVSWILPCHGGGGGEVHASTEKLRLRKLHEIIVIKFSAIVL